MNQNKMHTMQPTRHNQIESEPTLQSGANKQQQNKIWLKEPQANTET